MKAVQAVIFLAVQVSAQFNAEQAYSQRSTVDSMKQNNLSMEMHRPNSQYGAWVRCALYSGGRLEGELLAVDSGSIWVRAARDTGHNLQKIPLSDVKSIRTRRHELSAQTIAIWVLVASTLTTAGMAAACSQTDADCGAVALGVMGSWAVVWGISALLIWPTKKIWPTSKDWNTSLRNLNDYARFPLGLPEGFLPPDSSGHSEEETINPSPAENH